MCPYDAVIDFDTARLAPAFGSVSESERLPSSLRLDNRCLLSSNAGGHDARTMDLSSQVRHRTHENNRDTTAETIWVRPGGIEYRVLACVLTAMGVCDCGEGIRHWNCLIDTCIKHENGLNHDSLTRVLHTASENKASTVYNSPRRTTALTADEIAGNLSQLASLRTQSS
ncbi:hypothetical protein CHU98_g10867 [Xylaria longipes]|nr:hypothetical protein CHU98_g10867 [Xylaria longipes]